MKPRKMQLAKRITSLILTASIALSNPLLSSAKTVSKSVSGKTYSSTTGGENAVLVSGNKVRLSKITVKKTGSSSGDEADFYGVNAAVLAKNNAAVTVYKSKVVTNGTHANGIFSYGSGTKVTVKNTTIKTTGNCSGGIMTTGGATMVAKNLKVTTTGNSSAAIRSDRGGGTVKVSSGKFITKGVGSPAIYSTAAIAVSGAKLTAKKSEAVVIEGGNSVKLLNSTVVGCNSVLNGQSQVKTNVLIYQSMSGDASSGSSSFVMKKGKMTSKAGSMFYVTNTTTAITLSQVKLVNSGSSDLLIVAAGPWGNSGSNGGHVTLNTAKQTLKGNITVDQSSSLTLNLKKKSTLKGSIENSGTTAVSIASGCTWTLTGDSSVSSLTNKGTINLNGYTLTVNGEEYTA